MKIRYTFALASLLFACLRFDASAQTANANQQITLEGLLTANAHGKFAAAGYGPGGNLYLLLDEHDGIRLLKTNATATTVLAQIQNGATGDSGLAMAIDPAGNVYVTGTTTSGMLTGSSGTPFPTRADTSTNSFLAKYDANLNLIFFTFLGAGQTAAASVAATADAVFVSGITFNTAFPVTPAGIQQSPASGSSENGFVERFSADGTALVYATYLTGVNGNTMPTAIAADASDNAYVTGATSATGFPTLSALQPSLLSNPSGFLAKLNPGGSGFVFSTFIAGAGLTSLALDHTSNLLLLSGNISLGQFPIATVTVPIAATSYQSLLRIPVDGQSVMASVLLVPGTQSFVQPAPGGAVWISGALTTPLFPGGVPPDYTAGDSFLLRLNAQGSFDQTLRFGGLPVSNLSYASLASTAADPAVSADGLTVSLPGSITASVSSSLLSTQTLDLPFVQTPNAVLPNQLGDVLPNSVACGSSSQCNGSGAFLAQVTTSSTQPSLSFSANDLPNITLRNLGSAAATGLAIMAAGFSETSNCGPTLAPSSQCSIALIGSGPGSLTASAANAAMATASLPTASTTPDSIVLSTNELDFGIETSTGAPALETVTVTNLNASNQTFTSAKDGGSASTSYTIAEASSTCASGGAIGIHTIAAGSSCQITLALTASSSSANDGPIRIFWKIGPRDLLLTGFAQAASLSLSASEIDFGTQFSGTGALRLPRYLYLSNNSDTVLAHAEVTLPSNSPFTAIDDCPSTLETHTVCQIVLTYSSPVSPSADTTTLTLDEGLTVLVTGETLSPATATGSAANPNLSVMPSTVSFETPVIVTGVSTSTQSVLVKNVGASSFALSIAISGDFTIVTNCGASLAGGASCTVLVSFAPSQPGLRQGVLSLTAGSGFAPVYVSLSGAGLPLLPANNGSIDLGQTLAGEPVTLWMKVQEPLTLLTASSSNPAFGVLLVQDTGSGYGSWPATSFTSSATSPCTNCWLGLQFLSQTSGTQSTTLTLNTPGAGNPYQVTLTGDAVAVQGLVLTPIVQDFGPMPINSSSAPVIFTLANLLSPAGTATVQSVQASGDFSVVAKATGGLSCSGALPSTAACFVEIAFAPTATGIRSGTLTITTSAGSVTSTLSGYGLADPGLAINPMGLNYQNVPGSSATQQTVTLTNTSTTSISIGSPSVNNSSFVVNSTCGNLAPGAVCMMNVTFTPQSATQTATLSFPVNTTLNGQPIANTYGVALNGGYTTQNAGLEILPNMANFGSASTATLGPAREFTINNLTAKTLTMSYAMPREFPLAATGACPTLAPGASCSFLISLLPATAGALTGTVVVQGAPTDGSAVVQSLAYMLGYGAGGATLSVTGNVVPNAPLSFGAVASGQGSTQAVKLTNSGTTPMAVRRITSEAPFLSTSNCGSTLAANVSCTVTVTYAPVDEIATSTSSSPRSDAGTLTVESDAAASPNVVQLTGIALPVASSNPGSSAVLDALAVSEGALTFANTTVGNVSAVQTVTLTNTGTTTIHVLSTTTAVDFAATSNCSTLLPGDICMVSVAFNPVAAGTSTTRMGTVEIASDAGTSLEYISLLGTSSPSPLTLSPTSLSFGTVNLGANAQLSVNVTNNTAAAVTFQSVSATGDYAATNGSCPANGSTLGAGASCTLQVMFTPTIAGTRTGTMSLATDATQVPLTVSLTGIGGQSNLQVSPNALAFGSEAVGTITGLMVNLLNSGTGSAAGIATTITGANAGDFTVSSPCSTSSLAPNQGCTMTVTFAPSIVGAEVSTLSIVSSDPHSPVTVTLSGSGAAGAFTLTVNGGASASATVASGSPATFPLTLTPTNGYNGNVALTCAPITAGSYATCSLLASSLTLQSSALTSMATINTVSSLDKIALGGAAWLLFMPLMLLSRRRLLRRSRLLTMMLLAIGATICYSISGCSGGGSGNNGGSGGSKLLYTPAGTYSYQVTASSTSGNAVTSSVTLTIIVQ